MKLRKEQHLKKTLNQYNNNFLWERRYTERNKYKNLQENNKEKKGQENHSKIKYQKWLIRDRTN